MAANNFNNPFVQFLDDNGDPISNGRVTWLESGTVDTLKDVYTDADRLPAHKAQNPHVLGTSGYTQTPIFMGIGNYAVRLEKSDGAGGYINYKFVDPYVTGEIDTTVYQEIFIVNTVEELLGVDPMAHPAVKVLGYYVPGDGGGGDFLWDQDETATPDNGVYFGSGGSGRWVRTIVDSTISLPHFGVFPGGTGAVSSRISDAITFVQMNPKVKLYCPSGDYVCSSSVSFVGDITVEFGQDFALKGNGGSAKTVTVSCNAIRQGYEPLVKDETLGAEMKLAWTVGDTCLEWYGLHDQSGADPTDFSLPYKQAMATMQDGATLKVHRRFKMTSAACTPSRRKVLFRNGAGWDIRGTTSIGDFTTESATPCLTGELLLVARSGYAPVQISAFTDGTISPTTLYNVQNLVGVQSDADEGLLYWDIPVTIAGTDATTGSYYVTNKFAPGCMVTSQSNGVVIGYIDPAQEGQVISTASNLVYLHNKEVKIHWFVKIGSSDASIRANALCYAMSCGNGEIVTVKSDKRRPYAVNSLVYIPDVGCRLEDFHLRFSGGSSSGITALSEVAEFSAKNCWFESTTSSSNTPEFSMWAKSGKMDDCKFSRLKIDRDTSLVSADDVHYATVWDRCEFDRTWLHCINNSFQQWRSCRWYCPAGSNDLNSIDHICQLDFAGSHAVCIHLDGSNDFGSKYVGSSEYWGTKLTQTGSASNPVSCLVEPTASGSRGAYGASDSFRSTYKVMRTRCLYSYEFAGVWFTVTPAVVEGSFSSLYVRQFSQMLDIGVHGLQLFASDSVAPSEVSTPIAYNKNGDQNVYINDGIVYRFVQSGIHGTNPKYIRMAEIRALILDPSVYDSGNPDDPFNGSRTASGGSAWQFWAIS